MEDYSNQLSDQILEKGVLCEQMKLTMKDLQKSKRTAVEKEQSIRKKRGKMEKSMRVSIELDLLPKYNVTPSKYHGGKMEGPAVRNMLEHGKEIFDDITNFIHTNLGNEDSRDLRNYASNEEVQKTCEKYGSLCVILDAVVSYIYSVDKTFDNDHIEELERRLSLLRKAWASTSLSFTPKMHLLLDHISNQVQYIRGFKTMGEDRIERSHQTRDSIDQQLSRLKDKKRRWIHRQNYRRLRQ